jgi:3-methyladenine DNA glycosylase AlkD
MHNTTPAKIAAEVRRLLKTNGSAEHARGMQCFFKQEIRSRGWRTDALRQLSRRLRREILKESGPECLLQAADKLFRGRVLEEKVLAVLLLEKLTPEFGPAQFQMFESWLYRVSSWADHDALVHYLIAPMIVAKPARANRVFPWARSPNRWFRRAACVALILGTRQNMFLEEIIRLSDLLISDSDDMVQKGLGWLLRETAKANARRSVPYLMRIRERAPRLVLRTACETLPPAVRKRILA